MQEMSGSATIAGGGPNCTFVGVMYDLMVGSEWMDATSLLWNLQTKMAELVNRC